jgi:hypothetical protein
MIMYREEECYWIYKDGVPFKRSSSNPSNTDIYDLQQRHPNSVFSTKRETRTFEELRSFSPLKPLENYKEQ